MAELISDAAAVDSLRVPSGAVWRTRLDGDPAGEIQGIAVKITKHGRNP